MIVPEVPPDATTDRLSEALRVEDLLTMLVDQTSCLHDLALGIEDTLANALCSCGTLSDPAMMSLQRIDYLRQSLNDMNRILAKCAPCMDWIDGHTLSRGSLADVIDMRTEFASFLDGADPFPSSSGESDPELW